jgi:hypothetical protein
VAGEAQEKFAQRVTVKDLFSFAAQKHPEVDECASRKQEIGDAGTVSAERK